METLRTLVKKPKFWLKLAYLVGVTAYIYGMLSTRVYDDPFITYRYAENLRSGAGFVYNPGELILSTTTPFFAFVLTVFGVVWPNTQLLASFIGAASVAAGGLLLWELGERWKTPIVGWTGLLLYPTFPLLLSTLGSETPLFLAFALGAFYLYTVRKYHWAVILLAIAILTRSDAVLVAGVLGLRFLWDNRKEVRQAAFWKKQPWGWVAAAVGILILWHGFAWLYYGAPLPVTLAAKQAQGRMSISQGFAPGIIRVAGWYAGGWQYWMQLGLATIGLVYAIIKRSEWLLLLTWTGLYFLAYSLLGVTSYYWYYAPLVPGWVAAAGMGISFIYWLFSPEPASRRDTWRNIGQWVVGSLLATLLITQILNVQEMSKTNDSRYAIYRAVGEWLAEHTAENSRVGALEVGIIGYYAQRQMVDFAGLIQPDVATIMEQNTTYEDTALYAMQTYQPEYLVLIDGAMPRVQIEFASVNCQPQVKFTGAQYNFGADMHVYQCMYEQ